MEQPLEFDRLLAEGLAASREGRREAALALFAQAAQEDPSSGIPPFLAGSEHASAGQFDQAELAFASAVLLAPQFPLARYQLEQAHLFRYMVRNDDVTRAGEVLAAIVERELVLAGTMAPR